MEKQELLNKVGLLQQAAEGLDEPNKSFKLDDISRLKIQIEGMAISDIAQKMNSISFPDIAEMDANIQASNSVESAQQHKVEAFNSAFNFIKGVISVAL